MNDLHAKIRQLYGKDTKIAYQNLKELEELSDRENVLYPYFNDFLAMMSSDQYTIRVRGFRLICKLAKWDVDKKIDRNLTKILTILDDEKPTAAGQGLQFLARDVVPYKNELGEKIKKAVRAMDFSRFNAETMRPLLEKEADKLVQLIDAR